MPTDEKPVSPDGKPAGDLTVADARHILSCEGGALAPHEYAFHLISVAATAWAIDALRRPLRR